MITKKLFYSALLFPAILIMNSGCHTTQITSQVDMQNKLLGPQLTNKVWVLAQRIDSTEINYYLKYNHFMVETNDGKSFTSANTWHFSDATEKVELLKGDYRGKHIIENDVNDCNVHLDINEQDHLYFRVSDYPDFKKKRKVEFHKYIGAPVLKEMESTDINPSLLNTSSYYYEELIFEPNGFFRKKVLLDNSCNSIIVTGKWRFRTPFASKDSYGAFFEIILEYDASDRIGIPSRDNVYMLRGDGDNIISLEKKYKESDTSFLATRSHYSIVKDEIKKYSAERLNAGNYENGKVILYQAGTCTDIGGQPDDKIIIDDPLTLIKENKYYSKAYYQINKRLCNDSTEREEVTEPNEPSGSWVAYAGLGLSTKTGNEPAYQMVGGGVLGIEKPVYKISENLDLKVGAEFSMQGGKYESHDYIPGGNYSSGSSTSRLNYLNFPVLVRYRKAREGFFAEAGLQPGLLLSAKDKGSTTTDIKDELKKFDVGVPIGVGYKFKNNFGVGLRIVPGLMNVNKEDTYKNKNMVASVRASYSF